MPYTEQEVQEHFEQETQRQPAKPVKYPSLDDYETGGVAEDKEVDILD